MNAIPASNSSQVAVESLYMCKGRIEQSEASLDCILGWENWRNVAYDRDCSDGVRLIESLKALREIFFSGEGSDADFVRIVKEDDSNLPRWLLQQCINEEVVREDGGEIAFQCLAMCSSIDRAATWMSRDSKDMSDLLVSISRAIEKQHCPPFSSDSCQCQISGLLMAALAILEEVLMATEQLEVADREMCGIGCTARYGQGILVNSLMKLMESGEESILLLTCRLLAFLNYLSPFCAGPLVLRGVKHHKNRGDVLSCLLHLFNSEKFPCTLHIAELLIDLAEKEVTLNTSDMLVCIDICLREVTNLPRSQKLFKKKCAILLRSFIRSTKWKVAGGEYREKDIKELLQAEGWDENEGGDKWWQKDTTMPRETLVLRTPGLPSLFSPVVILEELPSVCLRQAFRILNRSGTPPFYPQNRFQSSGSWSRFVKWTTQNRDPPKWSTEWWKEGAVIFTVFGVTGSSSLYLVRPLMPKLGLEGSFKEGPWSYRIGSLLLVSPCYTLILLVIGSLSGRHAFFAKQAQKMWGRFLPRSLSQKLVCPPGKSKASNISTPSKSGSS